MRLWIYKPFISFLEPVSDDEQVVITNDYFEQPGYNLTMVSDAAVHVDTSKVSSTWQLYKEKNSKRRVAHPIEHQDRSHSFRHKIETFHLALKDADENLQFPHQIKQYMACESGLKALAKGMWKTGHTMGTGMNLLLSQKQLKEELKHAVLK